MSARREFVDRDRDPARSLVLRSVAEVNQRAIVVGIGTALVAIFVAACGADSDATPSTVQLVTPSYITQAPPPTTTTTTIYVPQPGVTTTTLAPPPAGEQRYKVRAGDVLFTIARNHCLTAVTDAAAIADYNAWEDGVDHVIYPGLEILIPPGGCATGGTLSTIPVVPDTVAPLESTTTVDPTAPGLYTVTADDTLSGIAAKLGTTVEAIVAANEWEDGADHLIIPGETITVPAKSS